MIKTKQRPGHDRPDETPHAAACRAALREVARQQGRRRPHPRWYAAASYVGDTADGAIRYDAVVYLNPTPQERRSTMQGTDWRVDGVQVAVTLRTPQERQRAADRATATARRFAATAERNGTAVALSIFASMLNPRMRGAGFRWEGLEALVVRMATAMAHNPFSTATWRRHQETIRFATVSAARDTVRTLLRESDVQTWMPLPAPPEAP